VSDPIVDFGNVLAPSLMTSVREQMNYESIIISIILVIAILIDDKPLDV
jgi:hypothetical protein